ncbi:NAD(P)H-hydrate dehydratase [Candidatus Gottesmanbacteria bacterium]|nr:NAD(P)H-hydrate dehydratase [Candidatus Gottesmanbacteria bacterium]
MKIYLPAKDSHKGQNGRLLIIVGSHLFHAASLWALKVASRIVDLVHYSSVEENNRIVQKLKEEFRDGIIVPRSHIEDYINEDDCILIGPGMMRTQSSKLKAQMSKLQLKTQKLEDILNLEDEGVQTYYLTKYLLQKYSHKRWVIDAGALQMMEPEWIPKDAVLTPHHKEFERLKDTSDFVPTKSVLQPTQSDGGSPELVEGHDSSEVEETVRRFVKQYNCVVLLKGEKDIVASKDKLEMIEGGNAGMTKGGTGDVLAGLVAALYCKNDAFLSASAASYINKKAGEDLYKKMGYWFNASDLADQIPQTMKRLLL